jgi:hypothetical protein
MTPKFDIPADVAVVVSVWVIVWLLVLATALSRKDFDPITRLTWVLVIILVPIFGVVLFWVVAPTAPPEEAPDYTRTPSSCVQCRTVIPSGDTACPKCGWTYAIH